MGDDAPRHGRPLKLLNEELRERLLDAIGRGMSIATAASSVGITDSTLYAWQARGRRAAEQLDETGDLAPSEAPYLQFLQDLTRAHAHGEDFAAELLRKTMAGEYVIKTRTKAYRDPVSGHVVEEREDDIAPPDLRAIIFYLERRHTGTWGKAADQVEVSGPGGGPVEMSSDAELLALAGRVRDARAALEAGAAEEDAPGSGKPSD